MIYLRVACFAASNCKYDNVLETYGRIGNELLKDYDMALRHRYGNGPLIADTIEWNDFVLHSTGAPGDLRAKCHRLWPDGKGVPVIVCNLGAQGHYAETIPPTDTESNGGVQWYPYILINAEALSVAGSTLIHEMIHTTGLTDADHDMDPASVFYDNGRGKGQAKRKLSKAHADRLRNMYYAESA
jgi:hypothetical protein